MRTACVDSVALLCQAALLDACARHRDGSRAATLLKEMSTAGLSPTPKDYDNAFRAGLSGGPGAGGTAMSLVSHAMARKVSLLPSTCVHVLSAALREGVGWAAAELLLQASAGQPAAQEGGSRAAQQQLCLSS